MKVKCEYCGQQIDESQKICPNCGAPMPTANRVAGGQPKTIEELKQWYIDHKLPPEKMLALKNAKTAVDASTKEFEESVKLLELYQEEIAANSNGMVDVEGLLYPGVEVTIADVQSHIKTETRYCKLIRDGADIRVKAY